jgi:hypothetical protein
VLLPEFAVLFCFPFFLSQLKLHESISQQGSINDIHEMYIYFGLFLFYFNNPTKKRNAIEEMKWKNNKWNGTKMQHRKCEDNFYAAKLELIFFVLFL